MFGIITEYPIWFIIFCFGLGFLYAWVFYRKDKKFEELSKFVIRVMFALRLVSVSLISFLLLSPVLKSFGKTIEDPILIYAQDNSESLISEKDKSSENLQKFQDLLKSTDKSYDLKIYTFGENILQNDSFSFTEKQTDIANLIFAVKNRYYHRNIGALIMASDGIYNKGSNPEYEVQNLNFPIYTIALGDTSIKEDIILSDLKYNKIAFLNNKYPIQATIKANKLKGEKTILKVYDSEKLIFSKQITINSDGFFQKVDIELNAEKVGFHKLKIELDKVEKEHNTKNNSKQIVIEVVDSRQKVLLLANSPHPDISAIRQSLELNQNFEIEFYLANSFTESVSNYNLIILHQLPSKNNSGTGVLSKIINSDIPVLYILGNQSSLQNFDNLNTGLTTGAFSNSSDEVQGKLNQNFDLFEINPEIESISLNAPPIISPFGDYKFAGNSQILFHRKVKNIETQQPLLIFTGSSGGKKNAVLTGEGIWRWRMFDYKTNRNHYLFNELVNKIVQYLTSREIKERFKVINEKIVPENQDIIFKAEVYDKNFTLINTQDAHLNITDSLNNIIDYTFEKTGKSYRKNTGNFSPGDYKWHAETTIDNKRYKKDGIFTIVPITTEYDNLIANHKLLYKISSETNGRMYYSNEIDKLIKDIQNNERILPVSYGEKKTESLINFKLIFFILLILLSAEWFLRKFHGAY